jgi:hypothetical protein
MAIARIELELPDHIYTLESLKNNPDLFDPETGLLAVHVNLVQRGEGDNELRFKLLSFTDAKKANETVTKIVHECRRLHGAQAA